MKFIFIISILLILLFFSNRSPKCPCCKKRNPVIKLRFHDYYCMDCNKDIVLNPYTSVWEAWEKR
jgi:hypothetical protein